MKFIHIFTIFLITLSVVTKVSGDVINVESCGLSTGSKIHIFILKLLGKYELFGETETHNCNNIQNTSNCNLKTKISPETTTETITTTTTTEASTTTSTKKRGRRKTTTTVSTTTDLPFVVAENRLRFDGRKLISERVKVSESENNYYLAMIKAGRINYLPHGYHKMYTTTRKTTTTERILTDSDYYDDYDEH